MKRYAAFLARTARGPNATPEPAWSRPARRSSGRPGRRPRYRRRRGSRLLLKLAVVGLLSLGALPPVGDALSGFRAAHSTECRVVSVIDGDTVTLWCPSTGTQRARLTGFDAPEMFSPQCASELAKAVAATWALRKTLWTAGEVTVRHHGTDRYGRALVDLRADGVPVGRGLIAAGLARPYDGGRRAGWCG